MPSACCLPLWPPPAPAPPAAVVLRAGARGLRQVALLLLREQVTPPGTGAHLPGVVVGDDAAVLPRLPAPTEALVERHHVERLRALAGDVQILLLHEQLLGQQDGREI